MTYRTLHSCNLTWAVCHLFPRKRWRTHTYSVSGNHWPGEPRDLRKATSARKFRPAFGATSKTRIFYKYVVFKHSFSFYPISSKRQHTPSSTTQEMSNSNNMDGPRRHSNYTLTMRLFSVSEKPTVSNHKKERHFKYVILLQFRCVSYTHTHTHSHIYTLDYFINRISDIFNVSMFVLLQRINLFCSSPCFEYSFSPRRFISFTHWLPSFTTYFHVPYSKQNLYETST